MLDEEDRLEKGLKALRSHVMWLFLGLFMLVNNSMIIFDAFNKGMKNPPNWINYLAWIVGWTMSTASVSNILAVFLRAIKEKN